MAADTAAKRRSAMLLTMPFRGPAYPQGSNDAGQRASGLNLYALASTSVSAAAARAYTYGPPPSTDPSYVFAPPSSGASYVTAPPETALAYVSAPPDRET